MGKFSGTVLIFAGLVLGGYTLSSHHHAATKTATAEDPADAEVSPATPALRAPAAGPAATVGPKASAAPEGAAPETGETAAPPAPQAPAVPPAAASPPALSPPPAAPPRRPLPGTAPAVGLAEAPPRVPVGADKAAAGPPLDGPALIREIQRALRRVGCYRGQVNGVWTPSVRQAMRALNQRVNASLPVDQPDPVLLALAQSQESDACAASCPAVQTRRPDGRCLPSSIVAGTSKPPARAPAPVNGGKDIAHAGPAAPAAPAAAPPEGRMSLAGPAPAVRAQAPTPPRRAANAPFLHARVAPMGRSANARAGQRQRAAQRSYLGFQRSPGWAFPFFFMP